jgi:hypothetical protein
MRKGWFSALFIASALAASPVQADKPLRQAKKLAARIMNSPEGTIVTEGKQTATKGADAVSVTTWHRDQKGTTQRIFTTDADGSVVERASGARRFDGGQRIQQSPDGPIGKAKVKYLRVGEKSLKMSIYDPETRTTNHHPTMREMAE